MVRTQIYITDKERESLQTLSKQTGKTQSELIRQAIERLLDQFTKADRSELFIQAKGMWKDRKDLPDFKAIRREFDRGLAPDRDKA